MSNWILGVGLDVVAVAGFLILLVIVLMVLKRVRPAESDSRILAIAERVTEGLLALAFVGGLIFVTLKYS